MNTEEKLTAYALGELTGDEAREIEALIERDAAAKAHVDEMSALAGELTGALRDEDAPSLTEAQRQRIAAGPAGAETGSGVVFSFRAARWIGAGVLAAAALGLAFTWPFMTQRADMSMPGEVAMDAAEPEADVTEADERLRLGRGAASERSLEQRTGLPKERVDQLSERTREQLRALPDDELKALLKSGSNITLDAPVQSQQSAAAPSEDGGGGSGGGAVRSRKAGGSIFADPGAPPAPERASSAESFGVAVGEGAELYREIAETEGDVELAWQGGQQPDDTSVAYFDAPALDLGAALNQEGRLRRSLNREQYALLSDNPFIATVKNPSGDENLSTFSVDVDTASYANVRRYINAGQLPPPGAVRIEELINYFDYDYEAPPEDAAHPFNVDLSVTSAPWQPKHRLVRIGLKGYEMDMDNRPATNLVFLLDVSGSMSDRNKLPLVKDSIRMLVDALNGDDRVAIVTYAGHSGLALPSTYVQDKQEILSAVDGLRAGGSTHGSAGLQLAYETAQQHFIEGGVNRVILCTDGDFNVGVTSDDALVKLIEQKRESDIFLSVLGFGTGNYQDAKMEQLSNHGNGVAAYIDTQDEARKVLVEQAAGTLVTIAKDVKLQVDFNHERVAAYRLIGYSNRLLAAQDFADDTRDAGEIGAGHSVTALYEVVPVGVEIDIPDVEPSKYARSDDAPAEAGEGSGGADESHSDAPASAAAARDELLTVRLRYKRPDADESTRVDFPLIDDGSTIDTASNDVQFAAAVAQFGMLLRESPYKGDASWAQVLDLAESGRGDDPHGYRAEFIELVKKARGIVEAQGW